MMLTLSQFKKMYPQMLADAKHERRESMARFDRMVLGELERSGPDRDGPEEWEEQWLSPDERYENWDRGERSAHWAKRRRRKVRWWQKEMADLAAEFARALAAEGRVV